MYSDADMGISRKMITSNSGQYNRDVLGKSMGFSADFINSEEKMRKKIFILLIFLFSFTAFSGTTINESELKNKQFYLNKRIDFSAIQGNERKKLFIQTLVPIIENIETEIKTEKEQVKKIIEKGVRTQEEKDILNNAFAKYKVKNMNTDELLNKMIVPPTSLIIAQASLESGWGTSNVAKKANNLFGMKSFSKDQNRSIKVGKGTYYKKYDTIDDSVKDYIMTLARHGAYKQLRAAIVNGENSLKLVKHLNNYSEIREEYGRKLTTIIKANDLLEHDA